MIKLVVLVDEDVDIFSEQDVWWAMATRMQADKDIITISNVQGFPLDKSQTPDFSGILSSPGFTAKTAIDCTVPFRLQNRFTRTHFSLNENTKHIVERYTQ